MKRIDIDKTIRAKTIEQAAEKFAKLLREKGYAWAAEEMTESVYGGYHCCSNATEHDLRGKMVTSPKTSDWTYYWAIEESSDPGWFYAWFIDREYNS